MLINVGYIWHVAQQLKKSLGQHFLKDESVLSRIAGSIGSMGAFATVVEIGPGAGALTKYLVGQKHPDFFVVELDDKWAAHLHQTFPSLRGKIIHEDFLHTDLSFLKPPTHVVGNFPYNISSQIVFKMIEHRDVVQQMTGMFQKEVALRIAAKHGNKDYGVLSVLTQAYFDCTYLFDVFPESFTPPPKVMSGVVQLVRKGSAPPCDEVLFKQVVKAAFNQRRKTMRNSLKQFLEGTTLSQNEIFNLRPEQLSLDRFFELTNLLTRESDEQNIDN